MARSKQLPIKQLAALLARMIEPDPAKRCTAEECLLDPWALATEPPKVRTTLRWPRSWANFSPFVVVFPQECMGQLASFGPT
jgi:hypothetical protein